MFENMIQDWFSGNDSSNDFIRALLWDDIMAVNAYTNRITLEMFSFFDTGNRPSEKRPEKYNITTNRESGFGRYDVMPEPKNQKMMLSYWNLTYRTKVKRNYPTQPRKR